MSDGGTDTVTCCAHCGGPAKMLLEPRRDRYDHRISDNDEEITTVVDQRGFVAEVKTMYLHETVAYCIEKCHLLARDELVEVDRELYVANGYHAPRYGTAQPNNRTDEGR